MTLPTAAEAFPVKPQAPKPTAAEAFPDKPRHGGSGDFSVSEDSLPFLDQFNLSGADNQAEKQAYLEQVYGKDAVSVDWGSHEGPRVFVTINGKKYDADNRGGLKGFAADTAAHIPELVGMGLGGAAGGAVGSVVPFGGTVVGASAGAAAGGAAGKEIEERIKDARGIQRKGPGGELQSVKQAAKGGAIAEVGGRAIGGVIKKAAKGGISDWLTGTTDEIRAKWREMKALGGTPPIQSVAPDMKKFARMEIMAGKLSGKATARDTNNRAVLEQLTKKTMRDAGVPEAQIDAMYSDMKSGNFAVTGESAAEAVQKRLRAHVDMMTRRNEIIMEHATETTDKQLAHLEALSKRHPAGALGVDVGQGIETARKDFSTTAGKIYKHIDQMLGGKPIIDASAFIKVSRRYAQGLPENTTRLLDEILKLPPGPWTGEVTKLTFSQAQRFRTLLGELARSDDLTPTVKQHELGVVRKVLDDSISRAGNELENKPAINLLRKTDQWYKENIRKFADNKLNSIISQWKTGLNPSPTSIVHTILDSGNIERTMELKKMVGPEVWKRVQAEDVNSLLAEARDPMRPDVVDGPKLADALFSRRDLMEAVHGKADADRMMEFAKNLAVTQGKLPAAVLTDSAFKDTMLAYERADAQLTQFVKKDPVGTLIAMKARPAAVYAKLADPENTALLKRVLDVIGPDSKEAQDLRAVALNKVLQDSVYTLSTKTEMTNLMQQALSKYSKEQQELLFPNGTADALRELGKSMEFLFPEIEDPSMTGMSSGAIMNRFFIRRWWSQGMASLGRWLISHPGFQEYLIGERKVGKVAKSAEFAQMQFARIFWANAVQGVEEPSEQEGNQ